MIKRSILGVCFVVMAGSSFSSVVAGAPSGFGDPTSVQEDPLNVPKADAGKQGEKFLNVVKWVVNRVLWILWLVALLVAWYGGFQMVTAAGDDAKHTNGRKYLKWALIGIVLIWLARFIASLAFWLISVTTAQAGSSAGTES